MSINAFRPKGPTFLIAANATSPSGVRITSCANQVCTALRIFNGDENNRVWYALGDTAANAQTNAAIPTSSGTMAVGLPPLGVEVISTNFPVPNVFVSGITVNAVAANLEVTPGDGL